MKKILKRLLPIALILSLLNFPLLFANSNPVIPINNGSILDSNTQSILNENMLSGNFGNPAYSGDFGAVDVNEISKMTPVRGLSKEEIKNLSTSLQQQNMGYPFQFELVSHDENFAYIKFSEKNKGELCFTYDSSKEESSTLINNTSDIIKIYRNTECKYTYRYIENDMYNSFHGTIRVAKINITEDESETIMILGQIFPFVYSSKDITEDDFENILLGVQRYEYEPNDAFNQADYTADDDDFYGSLDLYGDVDWVITSFNDSGQANFWLGNIPNGCDYNIIVYDQFGVQTGLYRGYSFNIGNTDELVSFWVDAGVSYYIKIFSANGYYSGNSYRFRVKNYPQYIVPPDQYEPNNVPAAGKYLGHDPSISIMANFHQTSDIDFYIFTISTSGNVRLTFTPLGNFIYDIYLHDVNGFYIDYFQNVNSQRIINANIPSGLYYIQVVPRSIFSNPSYILETKLKKNEYAYSIGVNHGLFGEFTGNFTNNVNYASIIYGMIAEITTSYKNFTPDPNYMFGYNPNLNRRIASKIVFLNGHGNNYFIGFNAGNESGVYATGVINDVDDTSVRPTGYKYVGLLSTDMSTCDHISFVSCESGVTSGPDSSCISRRAFWQGAISSLGFKSTIHSRFYDGPKWLEVYNDYLANGYTISQSVAAATSEYPNSDLGDYAVIWGNASNTVASMSLPSNISSKYNIININPHKDITIGKILQDINVTSLNTYKNECSELINVIKNYDPSFSIDDYKINVNILGPDSDIKLIKIVYYIGEKIQTNKAFVIMVEKDIVKTISVTSKISSINNGNTLLNSEKTKNMISLVNNHNNLAVNSIGNAKNRKASDINYKITQNFYYNFTSDTLTAVDSVFYIASSLDNSIVDYTVETILK